MSFNFPFTSRELTEEVRLHPKRYGLVSGLNIFPLETIASTFVQITEDNGVLRVLAAEERGAQGAKPKRGKQANRIFQVPHFPHEDALLAKDLQDRKSVMNGVEVPANLTTESAKVLGRLARNHAITAEYLRVQCLKGIIKDGDGTTLTNLFTDFGKTQKSVDFVLGTDATDVRAKDEEVRGYIEDNVLGETIGDVEVLVDSSFFSKLIKHPDCADLYKSSPDVRELRLLPRYREGGITGRMFNPFGNVTYIEYRGSAPVAGGTEKFIATDEGHAYPVGTENLFATYAAPADTLTELNSLPSIMDMDFEDGAGRFALPIFISTEMMKHGKGVEFWSESNILPMCKQPLALVKVTTSN